jgi:transcription termination factor Rho
MSVEPSTLERSALERKDREELTTIAQALGVKPPSRARKAEIVQLILELTGVESGAAADAAPARISGKEASVDDHDSTSATGSAGDPAAPGAAPAAAGTGGDNGAPAGDEPPSEWELEFGGTTDVVDAPASEPASGGSGARPAPGPRSGAGNGTRTRSADTPGGGKGDGQEQARSDTAPADRGDSGTGGAGGSAGAGAREGQANGSGQPEAARTGTQQAGVGQQVGDGQNGGDQGLGEHVDVNEPGNRRRRRRGRRGKDDQTHVEEFAGEPVEVEGLLDLRDEGYGFLRVKGYLPSKDDIYVSVKQVRQFGLRKGDQVGGASRPAMRNEKNPALLRIDKVNGADPEQARKRRRFEDLTPLFPDDKLTLETANDASNMTARIVDLIAPIGKGQRGLIVSPPKAGKTAIVKQIARSVETNNPEVKLMVLLVDERPEEVTDMRRWLRAGSSEVVASTFDRPAEEHTQVAELTIERAKRLVEDGQDVCIILDGITRLARAYNLAAPATGRIMSGGVDSGALYPPKKFFGAARNIEEGGSLTILATALIETGSKMDEVIFEEFKGTGNMELRLDRRLAERRIYPAIDVDASSTRHEELLFARNQLNLVWALRRVLSALSSSDGGNAAALELLMDRMKTFRTNDEFLAEVAKNRLAAG